MDDPMAQLELLYRDNASAILAYFRRQPALAGEAEDLLQDTFVRALQGFARLQASASPRAYLFGIARYVGHDAARSLAPNLELATDPPSPTVPAEDIRLEPLRAAVGSLPEPHRETLLLKLHHDLSYEEIAEVLGIPIGTVRSRLHHAVSLLRATLNPPSL